MIYPRIAATTNHAVTATSVLIAMTAIIKAGRFGGLLCPGPALRGRPS